MSWDDPIFPRAAKNSIGFFVQFFLSYPTVVGGSVGFEGPVAKKFLNGIY